MMGTHGPMVNVVPTFLCYVLLQLKKQLFAHKTYSFETLLSLRDCEIDNTVTPLAFNIRHLVFNICHLNKHLSRHLCFHTHSNTFTLAAWAWRKHSWRRVPTYSLCATPCPCTPRQQTSSSGSLSSRRTLRVQPQTATTHAHTYTHIETSSHKTGFSFSESFPAISYTHHNYDSGNNRIMRLNRTTRSLFEPKLFNLLH